MPEALKPERATILVVDDDPACRDFLAHLFESEGFRVIAADCATQALETVRKEDRAPDLYVVDFMMPDMYGFELVHELRRLDRSKKPVIMFTATTRQIDELVEQEGVTYVPKSTGNRELLEALQTLLGNKRGHTATHGASRPTYAA